MAADPTPTNAVFFRTISNMLDELAALVRSRGGILDARLDVPDGDDMLPVLDRRSEMELM